MSASSCARLNGDSSEALVVSSSGLHAVAVRLTNTEPQAALAFSLTLKAPLTSAPGFTSANEEAFWTRTLPIEVNPFSALPCPEGIELGSTGITVTSLANFPLPAGKKLVQELRCQNLEVLYRGGGLYQTAEDHGACSDLAAGLGPGGRHVHAQNRAFGRAQRG